MNTQSVPKWFETTWFTIVTLVFIPPVRLFFLWRYRSWTSKLKWQITVAAIVWFFVLNRSGSSTNTSVNQSVNNLSPSAVVASNRTGSVPPIASRPVNTESTHLKTPHVPTAQIKPVAPLPTPRKRTAKQTIEDLMKSQFGDRLRKVEVDSYPNPNGVVNNFVKVEFNNSLRMTMRATKGYMEGDMQDAYKAIFTSGFKIVEAGMESYGEGTDQYGNKSRSPVYRTMLRGEVASKINWDNHRAAKWDNLWELGFLHQQYREENLDGRWEKKVAAAKKSVEPEEIERVTREWERSDQ